MKIYNYRISLNQIIIPEWPIPQQSNVISSEKTAAERSPHQSHPIQLQPAQRPLRPHSVHNSNLTWFLGKYTVPGSVCLKTAVINHRPFTAICVACLSLYSGIFIIVGLLYFICVAACKLNFDIRLGNIAFFFHFIFFLVRSSPYGHIRNSVLIHFYGCGSSINDIGVDENAYRNREWYKSILGVIAICRCNV